MIIIITIVVTIIVIYFYSSLLIIVYWLLLFFQLLMIYQDLWSTIFPTQRIAIQNASHSLSPLPILRIQDEGVNTFGMGLRVEGDTMMVESIRTFFSIYDRLEHYRGGAPRTR